MSFSGKIDNLSNNNNVNLNSDLMVSDDSEWEEIDLSETPKEIADKNQNVGFMQALKAPPDLFKSSGSKSLDDASSAINNLPGNPAPITPGISNLKPIILRHPTSGISMEVPRKMLVGLPTSTKLHELTKTLQTKLNNGHDIITKCQNGTDVYPTGSDVSDVMMYLQVAAEHKAGTSFTQGAISVEDPGGKIRSFLDRANGLSYQRLSTHVKGFQSMPDGYPRGMDLYGTKDDLSDALPYGKKTVLYQQMGTAGTDKTLGMPRNMLLIKLEEHGCFSAGQQKIGRGPTRNENPQDGQAFWGHVKTTIKSFIRRLTGNNSPVGSRKERVSSGLNKAFDKLSSWKIRGGLPSAVRTILKQNRPTSSSSGIRVMHDNIQRARQHLQNTGADPKHAQKLDEFVAKYMSDPQWDNKDVRIGNEVILTGNDIETPDRAEHAIGKTAQSVVQSYNKQSFIDALETGLKTMFKSDSADYKPEVNGPPNIAHMFNVDIKRGGFDFTINGNKVEAGDKGAGNLKALQDFFSDGIGNVDKKSLLLASQIINQSTLGEVMRLEAGPNGPTPNTPILDAPDTKREIKVDLFHDELGNTHIRMTHKMTAGIINATTFTDRNSNDLPILLRGLEVSFPHKGASPDSLRVVDYNYKLDTKD